MKKTIGLSEMMKTFDEHDWIECKTKMEKSTGDKQIKKMTLDEFKSFAKFLTAPKEDEEDIVNESDEPFEFLNTTRTYH
jgi:uncharacterized protein YggL (DUF469 family)